MSRGGVPNHLDPTGALVVTERRGGPVYEAKWRRAGRQLKRLIGPAWLEREGDSWRPRRGRLPEGYYDEKRATVRMAQIIAEHERTERAIEAGEIERRERGVTFREVAAEWLEHLQRERGVKPSTLSDYGYLLAEPGRPHLRGSGKSPGLILAALGDRPIAKITTKEISKFLRSLDEAGMSARSVNKHRQVLSAIFNYACREDTHALPSTPVKGTIKRREAPPAVIDFYEPEEIERLACAAADGHHRGSQPKNLEPAEIEWRAREDAQDAELFRLAGYTGLRLGELLALRWEDVDLQTRRMIVHRAVSAGIEGPTKSWQVRFIPIADPAAEALERLEAREDYTDREDYIFCSRLGRRACGGRSAAIGCADLRSAPTDPHGSGNAFSRGNPASAPRSPAYPTLADHCHRALHARQGAAGGFAARQSRVSDHGARVAR